MLDKAKAFSRDAHITSYLDYVDVEFFAHSTKVAEWVKVVTDDEEEISAAFLHDTIREADVTYSDLAKAFSRRVADLVDAQALIGIADVDDAAYNIWLAEFIDEFPRIMLWGTDDDKAHLGSRINILESMEGGSEVLKVVAKELRKSWRK